MDRGTWWAMVHAVASVGHNLATKPPHYGGWQDLRLTVSWGYRRAWIGGEPRGADVSV